MPGVERRLIVGKKTSMIHIEPFMRPYLTACSDVTNWTVSVDKKELKSNLSKVYPKFIRGQ